MNGRKIDRTELLRTVDRKLAVPGGGGDDGAGGMECNSPMLIN